MSRGIFALAACMTLSAAFAAEPIPPGKGRLFLIGGAERTDNKPLWEAFVQAVGGPGKKIAIFPTASRYPDNAAQERLEQFKALGLEPFAVPLSPLLKTPSHREVAYDEKWIDAVRNADAVFFGGGEQARILFCLYNDDREPTPLLKAVQEVYSRGGLLAGTSAGTAIMSRIMYRDAEFVLPTLLNGVTLGKEIDRGFGFLDERWIVDQHCLMKGRFARTLVPMRQHQVPFGIGIEEDTAVLFTGEEGLVVGRSNVIVLDASHATTSPAEPRFNWTRLRLSLLGHGDRVNLKTAEVKPGAEKIAGRKVYPPPPNFEPLYFHKPFYNDILGTLVVQDAMIKLIDNPNHEAFGLAFDGRAARDAATPGFEFRFSRDERTAAWENDLRGPIEYTILNLQLDVRPITIAGPLYK